VAGIAVAQFFVVLVVIEAVDAAQRLRRRRQVAR
jgi:hypothetical protein